MLPINENEMKIELTDAAFQQALLIQENDFTLEDQAFRISIDGKGCDGFTYAMGFTTKKDDDVVLTYVKNEKTLNLHLDRFTAHYCKEGSLDYFLNLVQNEDGFEFINKNEELYHGKFFKDESLAPPFKE